MLWLGGLYYSVIVWTVIIPSVGGQSSYFGRVECHYTGWLSLYCIFLCCGNNVQDVLLMILELVTKDK